MGVTGLVCLRKPSRVQHSRARLHALQNLDFKRLTLTHAQFGLPLNLTRTRAGTYHRCLPIRESSLSSSTSSLGIQSIIALFTVLCNVWAHFPGFGHIVRLD